MAKNLFSGPWPFVMSRIHCRYLLTTQHKKEFLLTSLLGKYFQSHIEWQTHSLSQEQVLGRIFSKDLLSATNVSQSKNRNSNLISLAWTALKKHQVTGESIRRLTVLAAGRGTCPLFLSHKKWKMFCRMKQTECKVIIWRKKTLICQWRAQKRYKTRIHSYTTSNVLSSLPCGKGFSHVIL